MSTRWLSLLRGLVGHFVVTSTDGYVNYHAYRITYIISRRRGRSYTSLAPRAFLPQVRIVGNIGVSATAIYHRYRSTPYTGIYPGNTVDHSGKFIRIVRRHYVNYGAYIITYPCNTVRIIMHPIVHGDNTKLGMQTSGTRTGGYSLYGRHRSNPTYVTTYPARTLVYISHGGLRRLDTRGHHHATLVFWGSCEAILTSGRFPRVFMRCRTNNVTSL